MRKNANPPKSFQFHDGDDILVTHVDEGVRVWANGHETFSRVNFHDDHIEFRQLTDDGDDITDVAEVKRTFNWSYFRSLGDVAYNGTVLFEGQDKWMWHSVNVPYPDGLNDFRERYLVREGANSFPLQVMSGDGEHGEFTLPTIIDTLATKKLPIGADPGYFVHDMGDHAVGMSTIDRGCMNALRSLAVFSRQLESSHLFQALDLMETIATDLDYFSFYRYFATKMAVGAVDPFLSDILRCSINFETKHRQHMENIIKANGFRVSGITVARSPETINYYASVLKLLDPLPPKSD